LLMLLNADAAADVADADVADADADADAAELLQAPGSVCRLMPRVGVRCGRILSAACTAAARTLAHVSPSSAAPARVLGS
jgi:hypothetical protein